METLSNLHKKYIKGTEHDAIVINKTILLCNLTNAVRKCCGFLNKKGVYITTKCLKHIYDRKTAEHYDCIIQHLHKVVKYPDQIYRNKPGKRGDLCLVKIIKNKKYLCAIEEKTEKIEIATAFRYKDNYLKDYELLWSWKDDKPSS